MMTEREYKRAVMELGCVACYLKGFRDLPICDPHHIRHGAGMGQKNSDYLAIGLCRIHHTDGGFGVAFHAGPRTFQKNFLSEHDLVMLTRRRLHEQGYDVEGLPAPPR